MSINNVNTKYSQLIFIIILLLILTINLNSIKNQVKAKKLFEIRAALCDSREYWNSHLLILFLDMLHKGVYNIGNIT